MIKDCSIKKYRERVDKVIASTGAMSRRDVKKAASKNRIRLNGVIVNDVSVKASDDDVLTLDGVRVEFKMFTYIMMNKPKGYVCSMDDPTSPTVNELLSDSLKRLRLFSIGRLDKNTTGLVILTNDGALAHSLLSPSRHVYKKYLFETKLPLQKEYAQIFEKGAVLEDGTVCRPAILETIDETHGYITVCEGKFHQIKRMFASVGNGIAELARVSIGGVALDKSLNYAEYRELTNDELAALKG